MTATTQQPGTALAINAPIAAPPIMSNAEIDQTFRVAKALAMSGLFKDARQAEQAFAKILVGRDLGLSPTQAMMGIHIIDGKPELSANLQAAFVKRTPGYDYRVTELTDQACEIAYYRDGEEIGRSRFTIEDAEKAGLGGRGPWKAYPRNMLFARAMSNGVAFFCPEVTGGLRVYSDGEISGDETPPAIDQPVDVKASADTGEPEPADAEVVPDDDGERAAALEAVQVAFNSYIDSDLPIDRLDLKLTELGADADDIPAAFDTLPIGHLVALDEWMRDEIAAADNARGEQEPDPQMAL